MEKLSFLPFLVHFPPTLVQPSAFSIEAALAASPVGGKSFASDGSRKLLWAGSISPLDDSHRDSARPRWRCSGRSRWRGTGQTWAALGSAALGSAVHDPG